MTVGGICSSTLAAADVADQAAGEAALLAVVERLFDRRVEVGVDLQLLAAQLPALAVVADLQRVAAAARAAGARTALLRFVGVHAADVDAADRHAVGDLVLLRAVVGVGAADARARAATTAMTIAIFVLRPNCNSTSYRLDVGMPVAKSRRHSDHSARRASFPAISHVRRSYRQRGGYVSPVRSKDEVRKEVWKAMDREGVSRFPGAEGRIPNFAGAKLAAEKLAGHRLWKRARVIKANPDSPQTHARRIGARGGQDGDHGGAAAARPAPLPGARPEAALASRR